MQILPVLRCQCCSKSAEDVGRVRLLRCVQCASAWYCGTECQKLDWGSHKKVWCGLWSKPKAGQALSVQNPWFDEKNIDTWNREPYPPLDPKKCTEDEWEALVEAHAGEMSELTKRGAKESTFATPSTVLNVFRGPHGETPLHFAVMHGSLDAVKALLMGGAYVNATDFYGSSPLYYCASHPGAKDAPHIDEKTRAEIAAFLVEAGADPVTRGGLEGKLIVDAARANGHPQTAKAIETHRFFKKVAYIRTLAGQGNKNPAFPAGVLAAVRQMGDVFWRGLTAQWLHQHKLAEKNPLFRRFTPHPQLVAKVISYGAASDCEKLRATNLAIEEIYRDAQARMAVLVNDLDELDFEALTPKEIQNPHDTTKKEEESSSTVKEPLIR